MELKVKEVMRKIGREKEIPYLEKLLDKGFEIFGVYSDKIVLVAPKEIVKNEYDYRGNYTMIEVSKEKVKTRAGFWDCGACDETMGNEYKTLKEAIERDFFF